MMLHLLFKERARTKTSIHRRFTASIDIVRFSALLSYTRSASIDTVWFSALLFPPVMYGSSF
jgi:hypothetical protein